MSGTAPAERLAPSAPLLFDAVLMPQRSLPAQGFRALMAVFAGLCLAVGLLFYAIGAWPVVGFLGLELVLLWGAFRLSYRSGRLRETLELSREALTVRRRLPSGQTREWRFQPYWLRVELDQPEAHDSRLTLASHGRRVTIGSFLTAAERRDLAHALGNALGKLRCLPAPAPQG